MLTTSNNSPAITHLAALHLLDATGTVVATKDYARLMRRLPDLLMPGAHALLCLNAPELGMAFLQDHMQELAPNLRFVERVANPAVFVDVSADRSLKVLVYQAPS